MKKTSNFIYILIVSCAVLISLFIVGFFVVGEFFYPEERNYMDNTSCDYGEGWTWVHDDGTEEPISIPTQLSLGEGQQKITIKKTIVANSEKDLYLSFNTTKHDIVVFVDGQIRYTYNTKQTRPFGSFSTDINCFIPIYSVDSGKEIVIIFTSNNNYTGVLSEMTLGTQGAIISNSLDRNKIGIVGALCMMFMGILSIILGFFVRVTYKVRNSITFLGMGVFFAGFWMIAESEFRQFMAPNFSLLSNMTYLSIMVIPMCFALYFDAIQEHRYRMAYMLVCMLSIVESIVALMLQVSGMADLVNSLYYSFTLAVVDVVIFAVTVVIDLFSGNLKNYRMEAIGLFVGAFASILTIVSYVNKPTKVNGNFLCAGLLFVVVLAYGRAFGDVLKMERKMNAAKQAQAANAQFLARMSDEMATPVNAILGMNKMILKESNNSEILEYARDVNGAGNYLLSIINEIQDLVQMNSNEIEVKEEEYCLMDMVRECYSLTLPKTRAKRLSLSVNVDEILPSHLSGDRDRLVYIISTLLSNSVKYTEEGNVSLNVTGKIKDGKLMLMVTVSDTGAGMKPEVLDTIFTSEDQTFGSKNDQIEGTGIGLVLINHLIKKMNGIINVNSNLGKGTNIYFMIPQGICSSEPCGEFSMGPNGDRRTTERGEMVRYFGKVLIVDDVDINVKVLSMLLKNTGLVLDSAKSGVETLDKVCHTKYDLILLDQFMPSMDGMATKEAMNQAADNLNRETPVILQVDNSNRKFVEENPDYGFAGSIVKPIKEEALSAILNKFFL